VCIPPSRFITKKNHWAMPQRKERTLLCHARWIRYLYLYLYMLFPIYCFLSMQEALHLLWKIDLSVKIFSYFALLCFNYYPLKPSLATLIRSFSFRRLMCEKRMFYSLLWVLCVSPHLVLSLKKTTGLCLNARSEHCCSSHIWSIFPIHKTQSKL
jgi:hypothetical protein